MSSNKFTWGWVDCVYACVVFLLVVVWLWTRVQLIAWNMSAVVCLKRLSLIWSVVLSQTSNYLLAQFVQQIGFLSHWDPCAVINLEVFAYGLYCNTVEWFWLDWNLSLSTTGFLQCFDAVVWVICPVKIVPEMTYKVSSGTLSLLARFVNCSIFSGVL